MCVPQVAEREVQVLRLRAQAVALQGVLRAHEAQLESGDEALGTLGQRLREAQAQLEDSRRHGKECELVICSLRENSAHLRTQVSPLPTRPRRGDGHRPDGDPRPTTARGDRRTREIGRAHV